MTEPNDAMLRALIGRLDVRWAASPHGGTLVVIAPAVRPAAALDGMARLENTDRAPYVPLGER